MLWANRSDALNYPADQEIIYFALLATILTATSQVSVLLSIMRQRLKSQKAELERALAHIQEMATHDELTGLANRRHLLDLLNQHALRHARGGPSFYVAMADLDHFKRINDTHGHAVGDEALRTFARQAQAQLRNTDVIGRWGGEEFLLLMPETPPGDPNVGLERLRANLANCPASEQVPNLRVRFSAGLSRYRAGEAIGDTIERADRAVYAAKDGGRNRTVAQ
ncbi:MAG: diguanylate cyclase, partial [Telluria sp.]